MITLARPTQQAAERFPVYEMLSADGFPDTNDPSIVNGTECYFIDTGERYKYDAENDDWYIKP